MLSPFVYLLIVSLLSIGVNARLFFFGSPPIPDSQHDIKWTHYHNQSELEAKLVEIHKKCPHNTRLYSIGKSVEGRQLPVIEISSTPSQHKTCKLNFRSSKILKYKILL